MTWPTQYDEATCQTAGELRAAGIYVPSTVPDCGWIPRESIVMVGHPVVTFDAESRRLTTQGIRAIFTVPFRWIEVEVK